MSEATVMTALLECPMGMAPCPLVVTPKMVTCGGMLAANIMDFVPIENIATFGMCMSLANPEVAAATTAALGVLTPMPCVPVTTPWKPGAPTVLLGGMPMLNNTSTCQCAFGGVIVITDPGQMTTTVE